MKFLFFAFFLFFLVSCSSPENTYYNEQDSAFLKKMILEKKDNAIWTNEIENDRLTKNLKQVDFVDSNVTLSPTVLNITKEKSVAVFPSLNGFGDLDISNLPKELLPIIENFFNDFSKDVYSAEKYFAKISIFSLVFFIDDLEKNFFKASIKDINLSDSDTENREVKKIFSSYVVGSPFFSEDEVQVPVRFFSGKNFVDAIISVSSENLFTQIKIIGWEGNGKF